MTSITDLQCGKAGEYLVCADLILNGYIAFLSEQGLSFDIVVQVGGKLMKMQVKTTRGPAPVPQRKEHQTGYLFRVKRMGKNGAREYMPNDVDIFALVALDTKTIGYISAQDVKQSMIFRTEQNSGKYKDEKFEERDSKVIRLRNSGKQLDDIAKIVGLTKSNVWRIINHKTGMHGRYLGNFTFQSALERINADVPLK